jgi:hypothetical protein
MDVHRVARRGLTRSLQSHVAEMKAEAREGHLSKY